MNKIILGTAALNSSYGWNKSNNFNDFKSLLVFSRFLGIDTIDTAPSYFYGLKNANIFHNFKFKIISKIPTIRNLTKDVIKLFLNKQLLTNYNLFKTKKIYCLLFHDADDFYSDKIKLVLNELILLKKKGIIKKIGVSVYHPQQIFQILNVFHPLVPDIVQLPINILDNRFKNNDMLKLLKDKKIEIHARSIFLQGILLNNFYKLPAYFFKWKEIFLLWEKIKQKAYPETICFNYVYNIPEIDKIIIGFTNLNEINSFYVHSRLKKHVQIPKKLTSCSDINLLNPQNWLIK